MKKTIVIGFCFALVIIAALFFWHRQSHPSDSVIRQKLRGTWSPTIADGRSHRFTMSADGSWAEQIVGKIRTGSLVGTWQFMDGSLITTITTNDMDIQVPSTHSSKIIRIDSHEFVVQSGNAQVVFKRIEP
jgi:hypothetical protein